MASQSLVIEGGHPIGGTLRPSGNKNAALPLLAACLLTEDEVHLNNVPDIVDVQIMLELIEYLGATVKKISPNRWSIRASPLSSKSPPTELCRRIRASLLLAGPLLARRGQVSLPPPGGDAIGRRRLDTHVEALAGLGATVNVSSTSLDFSVQGRLSGTNLFLDEASVTGTENAIMAAALADGITTIDNAAGEPHVQDLCRLLVAMGAKIEGIGTNRLRIHGQTSLTGAEYTLGPDYTEVGSFITLSAVTGGELRLLDARPEEHRATKIAFAKLGLHFEADGPDIVVPGDQNLRVAHELMGAIPKIEDSPWPGFPADLTSIAVVAATQTEGTVLIFEKMFESRLFFTDRLSAMGAKLILCDPHRVVVSGKSQLFGQPLVSPDIRAGMALVIAALAAKGQSEIHNVQQIDRGYERIDTRIRELGGRIERRSV
ncbi:MAG: UDP-N-acetylglucosamine 1-carboxyvinyltransferase [Myxococcales bacterium]|nr:UDP-N-acetylglucosamine 1-carboxyvinyltransferase [Myxococcales bacterium]